MSNEPTKEEVRHEYIEWMFSYVYDDEYFKNNNNTYRKLMIHLYFTEFYEIVPMDGNRAEEGVNLRYRFGAECDYPDYVIAEYLDDRPCSVLEMMVALAIRCEVHIMENPDLGDRVGQWFWEMIVNLGLGHMTDDKFDADYTDKVLHRFLERDIERDGTGGLFKIKDPTRDMRTADIWYQMCWHLNEILD